MYLDIWIKIEMLFRDASASRDARSVHSVGTAKGGSLPEATSAHFWASPQCGSRSIQLRN